MLLYIYIHNRLFIRDKLVFIVYGNLPFIQPYRHTALSIRGHEQVDLVLPSLSAFIMHKFMTNNKMLIPSEKRRILTCIINILLKRNVHLPTLSCILKCRVKNFNFTTPRCILHCSFYFLGKRFLLVLLFLVN